MAIILLAAAGGSPGVTTTAIGLALHWPRDVLVVDCDEHPAHAVLSGVFGGIDPQGRGLAAIARTHREGKPVETEILPNCLQLAAGTPRRLFLPGFSQPGAPAVFGPVWPALVAGLQGASRTGMDVIVDIGRVTARELPTELATGADTVLLCTRTSLRALACLGMYLPALQSQLRDASTHLGVVLIGAGRPYAAGEIGSQFGIEITGEIAWDPAGSQVYSDGEPPPRRFAESSYVKSLQALASRVVNISDPRLRAAQGIT